MLSEISQAERVNYHMVLLTCIKNNMEDMRRRKGEVNWGKSEGEMNHERLWTERLTEGFGVGGGKVGGGVSLMVVLWKAHIAWSTGCGA